MAEIAFKILEIAMRPGLSQKTMQEVAKSRGQQPPLVIGTKQALEETQGGNTSPSSRLVINPSPLLQHLAPYINWQKK